MVGVSPQHVEDMSKHFTITTLAITQVLLAKGICTEAEMDAAINVATAQVDQLWQERKDKLEKEFNDLMGIH